MSDVDGKNDRKINANQCRECGKSKPEVKGPNGRVICDECRCRQCTRVKRLCECGANKRSV